MSIIPKLSIFLLLVSCDWLENVLLGDSKVKIEITSSHQQSPDIQAPYSNQIVIQGKKLLSVDKVTVGGRQCRITRKNADRLFCTVPELPRGWYDIQIKSIIDQKEVIKNGYVAGVDVVGSERMISNGPQTKFFAKPLSHLFMSTGEYLTYDELGRRLLVWNTHPTSSTTPFDRVIYHMDARPITLLPEMPAWAPGRSLGMCEFMGKFVISDEINHRLLLYNKVPTKWNQRPDFVLGQNNDTDKILLNPPTASSLNTPKDLWCNDQYLIVTDAFNHRVLVWKNAITKNNQPADLVLGQDNFTGNSIDKGGAISDSGMNHPINVHLDEFDRLFVSEMTNNRILVFENFSQITSGASAQYVIGQDDFTTNVTTVLKSPRKVVNVGNFLILANQSGNAIDIYDLSDMGSGTDYKTPFRRLGTGLTGTAIDATRSGHYVSLHQNKLYFLDINNSRTMIWNDIPALINKSTAVTPFNHADNNIPASSWLHQYEANLMDTHPDLYTEKTSFNLRGGVFVGTDLVILSYNNQLLVMEDYRSGDKNFTHNLSQNQMHQIAPATSERGLRSPFQMKHYPEYNQTFIADSSNNRVIIYEGGVLNPTSIHALGQNNLTSMTAGNTAATRTLRASLPRDVCRTKDYIFVADSANNRVVAYSSALTADLSDPANPTFSDSILFVIGQEDPTKNGVRATSAKDFNLPMGVWCDENKLLVADQLNHRVLEFSPLPTSNYPEASRVIGQKDFTSNDPNLLLFQPRGISSDGTNLIITNPEAHNALYWHRYPSSPLAQPDHIFGQRDMKDRLPYCGKADQLLDINCFHTVYGAHQDEQNIIISDSFGGRILIFPKFPK